MRSAVVHAPARAPAADRPNLAGKSHQAFEAARRAGYARMATLEQGNDHRQKR